MKAHKIEETKMNNETRLVRLETIIESTQKTLERLDKRFDGLELKLEAFRIEAKSDLTDVKNSLSNDIKDVDKKLSTFKTWIIGVGIMAFMSIGGEILNIALRMVAK